MQLRRVYIIKDKLKNIYGHLLCFKGIYKIWTKKLLTILRWQKYGGTTMKGKARGYFKERIWKELYIKKISWQEGWERRWFQEWKFQTNETMFMDEIDHIDHVIGCGWTHHIDEPNWMTPSIQLNYILDGLIYIHGWNSRHVE